jgi:hypothetical protein
MASDRAIFELERFAWGASDRLELSGKFTGLPDVSADAPVLVIVDGDRVHRLPAVRNSVAGPPEEGRRWRAAFAWQDLPVAFDVAELQLGADIVVELPKPVPRRARFRRGMRGAAEAGGPELREARELIEAQDAAMEELRGELEAAAARQTEAESEAGAELDALRERIAMLERAVEEADQVRAELERTRGEADGARAQLAQTRSAVEAARSEAERLLGRLSAFRDEAGDRA